MTIQEFLDRAKAGEDTAELALEYVTTEHQCSPEDAPEDELTYWTEAFWDAANFHADGCPR
jgi:hypothetical protein